ncbi:MAG TPA: alpha/beta hydrolase [Acidimicrobiales bacterium]|nr:alpha/beta hydrolase [Acidimicrobiales bacterium]
MALLPALQAVLDSAASAARPDAGATIDELRARAHESMLATFLAFSGPPAPIARIDEHLAPVEGDKIRVRVYTPLGEPPFGVHVYFHGGAFWLGHPEHFDTGSCNLAAGAGCVVASVDYRLAPEHPFPTPVEDCYAALQWVVANAPSLGVDPTRVSIGGGSAGGSLTAAVALMARDRGGPDLALQVLEIPVTDLTMSQPSVVENGTGYLLTRESIAQYVDYYTPNPADRTSPYASPLLAADLRGLPPALVTTMEYDPLRDEGESYARRLQEAGVPVSHRRWGGHFHGSMAFVTLCPDDAAEYHAYVADAVRRALES